MQCKTISRKERAVNDFTARMRVKLEGRNHDDILNMDQMHIPYFYHANRMLDFNGRK
jgi:hypothetical protein